MTTHLPDSPPTVELRPFVNGAFLVGAQPVGLKRYLTAYAAFWLVCAASLVFAYNTLFPDADSAVFGVLPVIPAIAVALTFSRREGRPMTPSERVRFSTRAAGCAIATSVIPAIAAIFVDSPRDAPAFNTWVLPLTTAALFIPTFFLNLLVMYAVELSLSWRIEGRQAESFRRFAGTILVRGLFGEVPRHARSVRARRLSVMGAVRRKQAGDYARAKQQGLTPVPQPLFWSAPPKKVTRWPPNDRLPYVDFGPCIRSYDRVLLVCAAAALVSSLGIAIISSTRFSPNASVVAGLMAVLPATSAGWMFAKERRRSMTLRETFNFALFQGFRPVGFGFVVVLAIHLLENRSFSGFSPFYGSLTGAVTSNFVTIAVVQGAWRLQEVFRQRRTR